MPREHGVSYHLRHVAFKKIMLGKDSHVRVSGPMTGLRTGGGEETAKETDRQTDQGSLLTGPSDNPGGREKTPSQDHSIFLTHKTIRKCNGCLKSLNFKMVLYAAINN